MLIRTSTLIVFIFSTILLNAQDSLLKIPPHYYHNLGAKANNLERKLSRQSGKLLNRMARVEKYLQKKLSKTDSVKAKEIFNKTVQKYRVLQSPLGSFTKSDQYIPSLDTMKTFVKFLNQNKYLLQRVKDSDSQLAILSTKIEDMVNQFKMAGKIKDFIQERQLLLRQELSQSDFKGALKRINRQTYYYIERINEYKSMLADHKRTGKKLVALLKDTDLFKDFMRKNSELASLFPVLASNSSSGMVGLQTRAEVNIFIQQHFLTFKPNATGSFSQNIGEAQTKLNQLKNRVEQSSTGSCNVPDGFNPNPDRVRSFLQRIKLKTDFQTTRQNPILPFGSDLGVSMTYPIHRNYAVMIGSSFKMGWGTGFNHLRISNEGFSLRSGIEWRLKSNVCITGNYEQNFFTVIRSLSPSPDQSSWKKSALLGLTKKYTIKGNRKGDIKLLYDFFCNRPPVKTQPLTIRINYNLR